MWPCSKGNRSRRYLRLRHWSRLKFFRPMTASATSFLSSKSTVQWGVRHIWLADPDDRKLFTYGDAGLHEVIELRLPEYEIAITLADLFGAPCKPLRAFKMSRF